MKSINQIAKHFYLFFFLLFGLGCFLAIVHRDHVIDIQLHDTYFVIPSIHIIFSLAIVMAIIAILYQWVPKFLKRTLNVLLGKVHFWLSVTCLLLLSASTYFAGMVVEKRIYYSFGNTFNINNNFDKIMSLALISILVLLLAQILPILNLLIFSSKDQNKKRQDNPLK